MKSLLLILLAGMSALLATTGSAAPGDKDDKVVVRLLRLQGSDPATVFQLGGQSKLTTLADAVAVEKLVGKAGAKSLVDGVDFTKEQIVLVSWTTSGPPDGKLSHEVKGKADDRQLVFFVQGPIGAKVRGQRARIGVDFFAVPRNVAVTFDPKERG